MSSDSTGSDDQTVKRPAPRKASAQTASDGDAGNDGGAPNDLNLSPGVIAAIVGGLLVLTIVVFAVFSGGDDSESSDTTSQVSTATGQGNGNASAPATSKPPPPPKTPVGSPEGPPTDDFERADGPIGDPWVSLGVWEVENGSLRLTEPLKGSAQVTVRDMGASDGVVSAIARVPSGGQTLMFRYVDPKNHWRIGPVRSYATWGVFRVVDGKSRLVANTGLTSTGGNTTVTVTMDGPTIKIAIDGKVRVTLEDDTHMTATIAGFFGTANGTRGVWDDFYALPAGGASSAPATTASP